MDKSKWLERNGYLPITDVIIREFLKWCYDRRPEKADKLFIHYKERFTHYKRYGKEIVPYSLHYLETKSIKEIKRGARKMYKLHVIDELWPLKQIRSAWFRLTLNIYMWRR